MKEKVFWYLLLTSIVLSTIALIIGVGELFYLSAVVWLIMVLFLPEDTNDKK